MVIAASQGQAKRKAPLMRISWLLDGWLLDGTATPTNSLDIAGIQSLHQDFGRNYIPLDLYALQPLQPSTAFADAAFNSHSWILDSTIPLEGTLLTDFDSRLITNK